jgi:hypothetical protein
VLRLTLVQIVFQNGRTRHWSIEPQQSLQPFAALEMTAIKTPWKTLRVYHISTARRLLAMI